MLGLLLLNPTRCLAQNQVSPLVPGRILTPRTPQQPLPLPENVPIPSLDLPAREPIAPTNLPNIPGEILVKEFQFTGNTAFSQEELRQATESFINRPITFAELLQAEAAVTKLYTDAGYINSGAIIPANQTFSPKGAVVSIQIIEGSLEAINVKVDGKLNPDYVRSRLAIATGKPFNQKELLKALQLLQLNPLIKSISAEISAGSVPESSLLSVKVQEADTFDLELFADNGKVRSIGSFERGLRVSEGNLLGIGDAISLEYANSDGSNALYGTYSLPINPQNGTLKLSGQWNATNVIEAPFDQLDKLFVI